MRIAAVGRALPDYYYEQSELLAALQDAFGDRLHNAGRLERLHRNVCVAGRHLALPIDEYEKLDSFTAANDAFLRCATPLGSRALVDALSRAGLAAHRIDHLFFVTVTGVATPSIDARIATRVGLRRDVKRTPIFGLGCVAGAAGIARAADYLRGHPGGIVALLSVELCTLTLQRRDLSVSNLIASALFGDGAAAVILTGSDVPGDGPQVVASRSVLYPDTEHVMGWNVTSEGFRVVLSGDVPRIALGIRPDVDEFLAEHGLVLDDIESFVCHPGGPRVLEAFEQAFDRPRDAFALTWQSLSRVGNLSSASVLLVLGDTIAERRPRAGSPGLLISMGPGFCAELVLLRW